MGDCNDASTIVEIVQSSSFVSSSSSSAMPRTTATARAASTKGGKLRALIASSSIRSASTAIDGIAELLLGPGSARQSPSFVAVMDAAHHAVPRGDATSSLRGGLSFQDACSLARAAAASRGTGVDCGSTSFLKTAFNAIDVDGDSRLSDIEVDAALADLSGSVSSSAGARARPEASAARDNSPMYKVSGVQTRTRGENDSCGAVTERRPCKMRCYGEMPSLVPPESPSPDFGAGDAVLECFPSHATVYSRAGKRIYMKDLKIGDEVAVVGKGVGIFYSHVLSFSHADEDAMASYTVIQIYESGEDLIEKDSGRAEKDFRREIAMTADHIIPVVPNTTFKKANFRLPHAFNATLTQMMWSHAEMTRAEDVNAGDIVFIAADDEILGNLTATVPSMLSNVPMQRLVPRRVRASKELKSTQLGLFNPHVATGKLIVDGVAVTCYTGAFDPKLAEAFLMPLHFITGVYFRWIAPIVRRIGAFVNSRTRAPPVTKKGDWFEEL